MKILGVGKKENKPGWQVLKISGDFVDIIPLYETKRNFSTKKEKES
jgi:hypothetical protein